MRDKTGLSRTAADQDESFDALLRQVAHVSGAAPRAQRQLCVGTSLSDGRFQIARKIGEGGMGLVYEARDEHRRCSVALKTLARLDAADVYRLKNEFRSLADVSHSSLVHLHELFSDSEQWFFTMELIEGAHFDRWVRDPDGLDEQRLRAALSQLVEGIGAIHAAGKLHRDLKPSNVLVTQQGRVVVLDFGLAVDPEPGGVGQTLRDEGISGTPAYMAPEQAAGLPATAASDFYALGVMLFEALRGELPFAGASHDVLVDKQRSDAPSAHHGSSDTLGDLVALCDALLARDPKARPDLAALRTALGAAHAIGIVPQRARRAERARLLGRDGELTQLRAAYEATCAGMPTALFVSGESGIGKSALCLTFLDELRSEGHAAVLAGRCHERESVPFRGIDSVVDDLSRFLHRLPHADAAALMPREVYALARIFPALGRIDAVARAPKKDIADPQELRLRAFGAFCELLGRIRDRQPLVLYIDDAQWLDRDAMTFLGYVLAQHDPPAALVLLSHRSENAAPQRLITELRQALRANVRFQLRELGLQPLSLAAASQLAANLLGPSNTALNSRVAIESNGSPFFVEELSRHVQRSTNAAALTLNEAVLAHVDGLSDGARRLLEILAVAGRPVAAQLALDAAKSGHQHIDELHAERLVRRSDSSAELSVECYHDKIRESLVQVQSAEQRRALHADLLAALLARPAADVEQLAHHAHGAGHDDQAARYAAEAASRASASMAFDHAAALYARALELGIHSDSDRRELLMKLGEALANAGRGAEAARAYLDASPGTCGGDALELKRRAAEQFLISGRIPEGKSLLEEVLRALGLRLPRGTKTALLAMAWERLRLMLRRRGLAMSVRAVEPSAEQRRELDVLWTVARGLQAIEVLPGIALSHRYVRLALDSGLPGHAAQALVTEGWFSSATGGNAARAEDLGARATELAQEAACPETIARVRMARGGAAMVRGDYRRCVAHCEQAIETLRERCTGVAFELGAAHAFAQSASASIAKFAPAAELTALIDEASRRGDVLAATMLTASSVVARLIQGDAEGVRRHIQRAHQHWSTQSGYSWPNLQLLVADSFYANYLGDNQLCLERLQAEWPRVERGYFLRVPVFQMLLRANRGCSAQRLARQDAAGAHRMRALARSEARALARMRVPAAPALGLVLSAALALDQKQPERAALLFRTALGRLEHAGALTYAAAVKRRFGRLLGGTEGLRMVASGESVLLAMGAADLEATTRLLTFGIDVD